MGRPLLILLLSLPGSAAAQLQRAGLMQWRFDDLTFHSQAGRGRRAEWFQGYEGRIQGPLLNPVVGTMQAFGDFRDGAELNSWVNTNTPRQRGVGGRIAADLFRPYVRQFVRFNPSFSWRRTRYSGAVGRNSENLGWGFNSGLSLRHLPAFSISRQFHDLDDASSAAVLSERSVTAAESLSYSFKTLQLRGEREEHSVRDRLGLLPRRKDEQRRASLEANFFDLQRLKLQSLSLRTDFLNFTANDAALQRQLVNAFNLRTTQRESGSWKHAGYYSNGYQRDFLVRSALMNQTAGLDSLRETGRGMVSHSLSAFHSAGQSTAYGFTEGLSVSLSFASGTVTTAGGASGGLNRVAAGTYLSDSIDSRLTLSPRPAVSTFLEARTSGQTAAGAAEGGSRSQRFGLGANYRPRPGFDFLVRGDRTRSLDFRAASASTSDQAYFQATATPLERLFTALMYTVGLVKSEPGGRNATRNIQGSLDYVFWFELRTGVQATYSADGYNLSGNCSYGIGETRFNLSYEHRELSSPSRFSYLSVSIQRVL